MAVRRTERSRKDSVQTLSCGLSTHRSPHTLAVWHEDGNSGSRVLRVWNVFFHASFLFKSCLNTARTVLGSPAGKSCAAGAPYDMFAKRGKEFKVSRHGLAWIAEPASECGSFQQ